MNPYQQLGPQAFWRSAVADRSLFDIAGLWQPKWALGPQDAVATYGSCFAQHIGRALRDRGFRWHIAEPAPEGCPPEVARAFGYDLFSARTGNIYTTSLLRQWLAWASDPGSIPGEVWRRGERCFDPFRPAVEPQGFASEAELRRSRLEAVGALRRSIAEARVLVFTLGLTESWWSAAHGYEYPLCPGTAAGDFDADSHRFVNQGSQEVRDHLVAALELARALNPALRVILTVSPVPLTATASGQHVLVATSHSKAVLRAVAGELAAQEPWIDYFPSYEIITAPPFGGVFFDPNKRTVNPRGVGFVMDAFFDGLGVGRQEAAVGAAPRHPAAPRPRRPAPGPLAAPPGAEDAVCEEALLGAFGA